MDKLDSSIVRELLALEVMCWEIKTQKAEEYDVTVEYYWSNGYYKMPVAAWIPDVHVDQAILLLETVCKRSSLLDSLRWGLYNGTGIKSQDKKAMERGVFYTCTISNRTYGSKTIFGDGATLPKAICNAVLQLRQIPFTF